MDRAGITSALPGTPRRHTRHHRHRLRHRHRLDRATGSWVPTADRRARHGAHVSIHLHFLCTWAWFGRLGLPCLALCRRERRSIAQVHHVLPSLSAQRHWASSPPRSQRPESARIIPSTRNSTSRIYVNLARWQDPGVRSLLDVTRKMHPPHEDCPRRDWTVEPVEPAILMPPRAWEAGAMTREPGGEAATVNLE